MRTVKKALYWLLKHFKEIDSTWVELKFDSGGETLENYANFPFVIFQPKTNSFDRFPLIVYQLHYAL